MAMLALPHRSSNPLDRGSSDHLAATRNIPLFKNSRPQSSDDPLSLGGTDVEMREYVWHIGNVYPAAGASMKKQAHGRGPVKSRKTTGNVFDDDDGSSDELRLEDDEPKRNKRRKTLGTDEEEKEVVAEVENYEEEELVIEDEEMEVEVDEENTLFSKPQEEQEEILEEIQDLETAVPDLSTDYKLLDRLGTGTFSSVYKALDLHYQEWYNIPWHGHHQTPSSAYYQSVPRPKGSKVFVAVKRIYVTSSPERIRNEIAILDECRSCRHVSQLITAFRNNDQVVIVMPYQRNDDFRDYFTALPMAGIKAYMRCLFRALRDIHARHIIHRDVKPANFLFDPRTGIGTLCDFGLACRMEHKYNLCLHNEPTAEFPHGTCKTKKEYDSENYKRMGKEAKLKSSRPSEEVGYPEKDSRPHSKANRAGTRGFRAPEVLLKCGDQCGAIDMWSAGMILLFFLTKKFPLFQSNDDVEALMELATVLGRRNMEQAACLHSRTFATNVPSVTADGITWTEFVENQNPSLYVVPDPDVRFYPYTEQLEKRAERMESQEEENTYHESDRDDNHSEHDNTFRVTPIPSSSPNRLSINTKVENSSSASSLVFPSSPPKSAESGEISPLTPLDQLEDALGLSLMLKVPSQEQHVKDVSNALTLVESLLHPWSTKRITPRDALYHPFLHTYSDSRRDAGNMVGEDTDMEPVVDADAEIEAEPEDDEFFPHPFGEGVCGKFHFRDEVEVPCVYIYAEDATVEEDDDVAFFASGHDERKQMVVRRLESGEGIAIGRQPCEFHRVGYELDIE